jgi:Flp pilus assembly protein TadD
MNHAWTIPMLAAVMFGAGGCSHRQDAYTASDPERRDTARAERLTRQAADLIVSERAKAESLLREALAADLFHGPAHNNLGVIYLHHGRLYEAANEFEWARKLMPGHPDPRLNLGLALERGGRVDEAIDAYRSALEIRPEHVPAIAALVSCQVRYERQDAGTKAMLELIAMRGDASWRRWANEVLLAPDGQTTGSQ